MRLTSAAANSTAPPVRYGWPLAWLHNLRISQKLVLILIAMTAPLLLLSYSVARNALASIHFANAELEAAEYLLPLNEVLRAIARHRGLAALALSGDEQSSAQLPAQVALVEDAIRQTDAVRYSDSTRVSAQWASLKSEWRSLQVDSANQTLESSFDRHTALIRKGLAINTVVTHSSGLILDPDVVPYNLIISAFVYTPAGQEFMGQVRALASRAATNDQIPAMALTAISERLGAAESTYAEAFNHARSAVSADAALAGTLGTVASMTETRTRAAIQSARAFISTYPESGISVGDLFAVTTSAIQATAAYQVQALDALKALLSQRLNDARVAVAIQGLVATSMLALALLLAWAASKGINHHIAYVNDAIRSMRRGEFSWPITRPARDEFGELLVALGDLRTEFLRLLNSSDEQRRDLQREVAQRRETEAELRRMATAVEHAADGILVEDRDGRILFVNPAGERILGRPRDAIIGRDAGELGFSFDLPEIDGKLSRALSSGASWSGCISGQTPGRPLVTLNISVSPIRTADGSVTHHVCVLRDVTDELAREAEFARAQKLEAVGQLAAGIAHEINTPAQYVGDNIRFISDAFEEIQTLLAALSTGTEPLARTLAAVDLDFLREEIPRALEQSADGCQRISSIVQSMKVFAHPSRDKAPVDLNRTIQSTINVATNEWKYVAEMVTELDPDLPPVTCQAGEINQVVLNMLVNAAHAVADVVGGNAGGKGRITVSTRVIGDQAEIRISDTGTGIVPEVRTRIFDPFFTTKPVGRGTGQGLAIAHNVIVNKHGGTIGLESTPGKGSTFIIRIPVDAASTDPETAGKAA